MGHIKFWSSSLYRPRSPKYSFCIIKTRFLVSCTPHDANDGRDVLFTQRACSYSFSLPLCVIRGLSSLISSRHLTVVSSIVKTKCALMITAVKRGRCTCKWVGFLFLWRSMMEIKDKDSWKSDYRELCTSSHFVVLQPEAGREATECRFDFELFFSLVVCYLAVALSVCACRGYTCHERLANTWSLLYKKGFKTKRFFSII